MLHMIMISSMLSEEGLDMGLFVEYMGSYILWVGMGGMEGKHMKREVIEVMGMLELVVKAFGRGKVWEEAVSLIIERQFKEGKQC